MIETIISNPTPYILGAGGTLTGIIYFIRFTRRMYYSEKKDTSIDLANQSLFENLRLENERMAGHLTLMSNQLNTLAEENRKLNAKVSELTDSVRKLVGLENENLVLQEEILRKDNIIVDLTENLNEALKVLRLRQSTRE